jgi:IS6 family transposase
VIVTAVRWYCRFRLSLADVRDLLAERGFDISPRTILTWAHTFGPLLAAAVRRTARTVGRRWDCDETTVRVAGRWAYLYRAVDDHCQVVDVLVRERRDLASAPALFAQAIRRGDLFAPAGTPPVDRRGAARARTEVATLHRLAGDLRLAA